MSGIVRFEDVTVTYTGADRPTLHRVDLDIAEGELVLVVGETGSGKSTLLRCLNGLVPHFTGGTLAGRVTIAGRDTRTHPPRELADVVGMVGQDPLSGFVAEIVEDELAYGMECLGVPPDTMRRRVEETLDLLGLADLRHRALTSLSGGQRQRVAIGAALTSHPRVLVLDEPTSALDPGAAEEVLAALQRLVHDLGITVVLAEHRLERVVQYADQMLVVADGRVRTGTPAAMMAGAPVAPPVVELGRLAGWDPLPLSVRDARRAAGPLRARLRALPSPEPEQPVLPAADPWPGRSARIGTCDVPVEVRKLTAGYRAVPVLQAVDLRVAAGEVLALMGRNGAGKSTLLATMAGMHVPDGGTIRLAGADPARLSGHELLRTVGLVPQEPIDLLYATTVGRECGDADAAAHATPGTAAGILAALAPGIDSGRHPRDLSEGQRLALALAVVLAADPAILLLDEPTRGLDYGAKRRLIEFLRTVRRAGHTIVLATHDVELVAEVASRVAIIAEGEIVADGATGTVVRSSPLFAPQVAKILTPQSWLTVSEVADALLESG